MYEKKISPRNKKIEIHIDKKILKLKKNKRNVVAKKDIDVPDHVFLGLMLGTIRGPPRDLPKMYAIVSLKKDIRIIK
tara:strand:+ start:4794 stop:5024 length:231 start_codon:yes stop_codon:yes gene_type:complete